MARAMLNEEASTGWDYEYGAAHNRILWCLLFDDLDTVDGEFGGGDGEIWSN